jgi:predicted TIM-barrel fold metal-dependent hydrolase
MLRIDSHLHFSGDHPQSLALLEELNLAMLNICVAHYPQWRTIADVYCELTQKHPNRYAWCTSFNAFDFEQPGYADRAIAVLEHDFEAGAIACKVWKNVGMDIKDSRGRYVLPDDEAFDPIYRHLEQRGISLLMHIAEPLACWRPLDFNSPHDSYYKKNPQWHMYGRTDVHSHEALIASRDRVIERFPDLRVIGAHLGSLEYDVDEMAVRFRRYPNFAVDTSARTADFCKQPTAKVREFLLEFPDRVLWGTDAVQRVPHSQLSDEDRQAQLDKYRQNCLANFAFYSCDEPMQYGRFDTHGLNLPQDQLQRLFRDNTLQWYPQLQEVFVEA